MYKPRSFYPYQHLDLYGDTVIHVLVSAFETMLSLMGWLIYYLHGNNEFDIFADSKEDKGIRDIFCPWGDTSYRMQPNYTLHHKF
jgi:hypothetical protein